MGNTGNRGGWDNQSEDGPDDEYGSRELNMHKNGQFLRSINEDECGRDFVTELQMMTLFLIP